MPYTTVVAATTITASWGNANVRDQVVTPFADAAARTSSITAPVEGMVTHLNDTNVLGVYSGAAWSTVGPVSGGLTVWAPSVGQNGGVSSTTNWATYQRTGRKVDFWFGVTVTGTGNANQQVTVSTPVTAARASDACGNFDFLDTSAPAKEAGTVRLASSDLFNFRLGGHIGAGENRLGLVTFTAALASGDTLAASGSYEAAADA